MNTRLTVRQLSAIATVAFLAPALRLLPGWSAELAGHAAWLCPLAALPVLLLLNFTVAALMKSRRPGEGLGGMILRALGRPVGRALLGIFALWFVFYAGFILRSGAERFISTIYPNSSPKFFVLVMLALALPATLGRTRALGRAAEIFRPLLISVMALVLLFASFEMDTNNLLPVARQDALPVLTGAIPVIDTACFALVNTAFLEGLTPSGDARRRFAHWSVLCCGFLAALAAVTVGRFGAEITSRLSNPFFILTRNTEISGVLERAEALVTALWVFPDFILVSFSLMLGAGCMRLALGLPSGSDEARPLDLKNGRWLIWLAAALALVTALTVAPTAFELNFYSRRIIPGVNLLLCFAALPLTLSIGKLRKKL